MFVFISYCEDSWHYKITICLQDETIRLPYAFKMRQDYLSTSYLDQKA